MTSDEQLHLLEAAVALRAEARDASQLVHASLKAVERRLLDLVGPTVRKTVAARLLGVSVQALDRWTGRGAITTVPIAEGSSRRAIPTEEIIGLAVEVRLASRAGHDGRILQMSIASAGRRRQLAREAQNAHNLIVAGGTIIAAVRAQRRSA